MDENEKTARQAEIMARADAYFASPAFARNSAPVSRPPKVYVQECRGYRIAFQKDDGCSHTIQGTASNLAELERFHTEMELAVGETRQLK